MKLKELILFFLFLFNTTLMAQEVVFDPANDNSGATNLKQQFIKKEELDNIVKIEISNSDNPENNVGDLNHKGKKYYSIHGKTILTISVEGDLKIVKVELIRNSKDQKDAPLLTKLNFKGDVGEIIDASDGNKKTWLGGCCSSLSFENSSTAIYLSQIKVTLNAFKISKAGYVTMWLDNSYIMPEGVIGHSITIENGKLKYLDDYHSGKKVKAELPLLIEDIAKTGTEKTYKYEVVEYDRYLSADDNKLKKSIGKQVGPLNNMLYYKFSYDSDGKNLGFYWDSDDGKTINIPYGKCYLAIPKDELSSSGASNVKGFSLSDIVNGIDNVIDTTPEMDTKVYDLRGVFIGYSLEGLSKGIYIQNGKKIVIK